MNDPFRLADNASEEDKAKAQRLPVPCGYKLLIALPQAKETSEGGILLTEETRTKETVHTMVGYVADNPIKLGTVDEEY